jgi:starvation-inducible DNA-binding protein
MPSASKTASPQQVQAVSRELSAENSPQSPVVVALCRQVANAFVLYLNYKHYHWQTYGPLFRDLHRMFDEFGDAVHESLDPLAERVRMIGQDPPGRLSDMVKLASVGSTSTSGVHTMREMIEEADRHEIIVIKEMRDGARLADEHDDPGTVDLFSKLVQVHEKHEWWLRDLLERGDGLMATS